MKLKTFRGGIHPPEHKTLSLGKAVTTFFPKGDLVFPRLCGADDTAIYEKCRDTTYNGRAN